MNRSVLYLVIGALVFAAGVFGYMLYQERQKTTGIEINVGKRGVSIEKKWLYNSRRTPQWWVIRSMPIDCSSAKGKDV